MTPLPETVPAVEVDRSRRWLVAAVIVTVVAAIGVGIGITMIRNQPRDPQTIEIVVPKGTNDRLKAREKVAVMPSKLEFTVGDYIRIRNEDVVRHSVGPYLVDAGEELFLRYGKAGTYEGYCPVTEDQRYLIVVRDP